VIKLTILVIFLLCFVPFADAGQTYIWTDENGQTRVSDTEPENWETQQYEETKESKQGETQRIKEVAIEETRSNAADSKSKVTTTRRKG
jgi:cell division protein FtsL